MRLIACSSRSDQGGAILPVEAQEIDVHASPLELKEMADFFSAAAARALQNEQETFEQAMDFADSKDPNTTPISFTVRYGTRF